MSDRHTVRSLAALAIVLAVAVSGCTDTARPKPLPSASPSPSSSASATPAPPTMPPEASGTSAKSAEAFVRYWVEVLNYAGSTGDVAKLKALSAAECKSCENFISSIQGAYSNGGGYVGGEWRVTSTAGFKSGKEGQYAVAATIKISKQVGKPSSASAQRTTAPSTNTAQFYVVANPEWSMMRFEGKRQ